MELIRRDGTRLQICREHRETYQGKVCPKCKAVKEQARLDHIKTMKRHGYVKVGRKWELGPPRANNPHTWREKEWAEARENAHRYGIFAPGVIREA